MAEIIQFPTKTSSSQTTHETIPFTSYCQTSVDSFSEQTVCLEKQDYMADKYLETDIFNIFSDKGQEDDVAPSGQVIHLTVHQEDPEQLINIESIKQSSRKLQTGLIAPATESTDYDLAEEHTSEPIKSMEDIDRISRFLIGNNRYRDNMLFIVGINFGLRVSDLRVLRFSHLITEECVFKDSFSILEKKTSNTRKHKRNRCITINRAVIEAVTLYLEHTEGVKLSDYMFRSESNRGSNSNQPIHRNSIDRILKGIAVDLGLGNKMATHSLRKTFAYHQMVMSNNDPRKLLLLQKMFGHSTAAQTLDYIGITGEEIEEAYRKLNLGSPTCNYLVDSTLVEKEILVG